MLAWKNTTWIFANDQSTAQKCIYDNHDGFLAMSHIALARTVTAPINSTTGKTIGTVTLKLYEEGSFFSAVLWHIKPGWHAIHFHQYPDCSDPDKGFFWNQVGIKYRPKQTWHCNWSRISHRWSQQYLCFFGRFSWCWKNWERACNSSKSWANCALGE